MQSKCTERSEITALHCRRPSFDLRFSSCYTTVVTLLFKFLSVARGVDGTTADINVKRVRLLDTLNHYTQFGKSRGQTVQERHVRVYQIHMNVHAKLGAFSSGHKDFTMLLATCFNHGSETNILDASRTYFSLAIPRRAIISRDKPLSSFS